MHSLNIQAGKPHMLKDNNRMAVINILRGCEESTITDIAEDLRLSKMTVGKVISYFKSINLVHETGKAASGREGGKRPVKYSLNAGFAYAIGVHIFPDHIDAVIYDLKGKPAARGSLRLSPRDKKQPDMKQISDLFRSLTAEISGGRKLIGIGIAVSGICDSEKGTLLFSPWFPEWGINIPLADIVRESLGMDIPVIVDNEFRFQVLAETMARDIPGEITFVVMGGEKGVGSGIYHNGIVLRGSHHLAGEIGHMVVDPDGEVCSCGGRGCFEAMLYESSIINMIKKGYSRYKDSLIFSSKKNEEPVLQDLFDAAAQDDPLADEILDNIAGWFSIAISNMLVTFDPDMVIIHGPFTGAGEKLLAKIRSKTGSVSLPFIKKDVKIEFSILEKESGSFGAALHVLDSYFRGSGWASDK